MKRLVPAFLIALLLTITTYNPASAASAVDCRVVVGSQTRVICTAAGLVVLNTAVNVPTPAPIVIRVPGPTRTETVTVQAPPKPPVTRTVTKEVPGPTVFVTGPQKTITQGSGPSKPSPTKTVTAVPTAGPTELPKQPSRQTGLDRGSIEASDGIGPFELTVPQTVGYGALSILVLVGLLLLGMYSGYYLGNRERGDDEVSFLRALRDEALIKKR